jgi:peptidoglycan/LPS O-acetylase OafA/YrhL
MVFFVLSGFLIGKSGCNNISRNHGFSVRQYARDRALRLYPPLIAATLLAIVLASLAPVFFPSGTQQLAAIPGATFVRTEFTVAPKPLLGALAFLNGFTTDTPLVNGPLWSLSLEAWYYVIAAALFLWPSRKALAIALLAMALVVTRENQLFFMLAPSWFAGLCLALLHERRPQMNNRLFGLLFAILTVAVAVTVALVLFSEPLGKGIWLDRMNHFRLVSGLWFACFMALIIGGRARFTKFFHSQSQYSYTLYVIHFPILLFILGVTQRLIYGSIFLSLLAAVGAMTLSIVMAKFLSRYIENKNLILPALKGATKIFTIK